MKSGFNMRQLWFRIKDLASLKSEKGAIMTNTADAIIIGGGIHGASLAFHLGERGMKTIVLEKNSLASGATGRSSGLIRINYDHEAESQLAWKSFSYFSNWEERVGGKCDFTRTGFIKITHPDYDNALRKNITMHQNLGVPTLLIDPSKVKDLAPFLNVDDFNLAIYEPESGYADPNAATSSLMDSAKKHGAQLIQGATVTDIQLASGKVSGVRSSVGDFSTPIVVNAAGAWAQPVAEMAGVKLPVDTWQHDVIFIRQPKSIPKNYPTIIDNINQIYFRPEEGGLTLLGLEDKNTTVESPHNYIEGTKPGFVQRAIEQICKRAPAMEAGSLHSEQDGYDGNSPDRRAILGQIGPEGFYAQCGFSGSGFKTAPAVGLCMAELIIDGEAKTVDISSFDPNRFLH
jgi:sarcosine oxidase subunit beta